MDSPASVQKCSPVKPPVTARSQKPVVDQRRGTSVERHPAPTPCRSKPPNTASSVAANANHQRIPKFPLDIFQPQPKSTTISHGAMKKPTTTNIKTKVTTRPAVLKVKTSSTVPDDNVASSSKYGLLCSILPVGMSSFLLVTSFSLHPLCRCRSKHLKCQTSPQQKNYHQQQLISSLSFLRRKLKKCSWSRLRRSNNMFRLVLRLIIYIDLLIQCRNRWLCKERKSSMLTILKQRHDRCRQPWSPANGGVVSRVNRWSQNYLPIPFRNYRIQRTRSSRSRVRNQRLSKWKSNDPVWWKVLKRKNQPLQSKQKPPRRWRVKWNRRNKARVLIRIMSRRMNRRRLSLAVLIGWCLSNHSWSKMMNQYSRTSFKCPQWMMKISHRVFHLPITSVSLNAPWWLVREISW